MGYMERGSLKGSVHVDTTHNAGSCGELEHGEDGRFSGKACIHSTLKKIKKKINKKDV